MKMPCGDCGKTDKTAQPMLMHPVLDRVELMLQQAWISEIRPEQRELVTQLIHAIQALKNPYTVPLEAQLQNLLESSYTVGSEIPCWKCRKAWLQDVTANIQIRLLLEQGKLRKAAWLYVKKEIYGKYWLLRSLPNLFVHKSN
jgi:hypothetical protein